MYRKFEILVSSSPYNNETESKEKNEDESDSEENQFKKAYDKKQNTKKVIIFPIFHYQGDDQYIDLIEPIVERGYRVITINLLSKGDKVLFFNYYYTVFESLFSDIESKGLLKEMDVTLLGMGIGANLVSYMGLSEIKFNRMILISPVNKYKGEYMITGVSHDFLRAGEEFLLTSKMV